MRALKDAKVSAEKIDFNHRSNVISPDSNFPSVACKVQKAIGAKKATAFDLSAACSGYLYAMTTAKQYIQTGMAKRALVIAAAEHITSLIDWKDRDNSVYCLATGQVLVCWGLLNQGASPLIFYKPLATMGI